MRCRFISAAPTDSALHAHHVMQLARIRHLPVVADGKLLGIVSHRDLLEAEPSSIEQRCAAERLASLRTLPLASLMHASVHTIAPDATLRAAAERRLRFKIGCLPVVEAVPDGADPSERVGLITESDLLAAAYVPGRAHSLGSLPPPAP